MANLFTSFLLAQDFEFRGRVAAAGVAAAIAVAGEDQGDISAEAHAARGIFAKTFLCNPLAQLEPLAWAVATNPSITVTASSAGFDAVSDSDIEYVVTQVWDDVSGASVAGLA